MTCCCCLILGCWFTCPDGPQNFVQGVKGLALSPKLPVKIFVCHIAQYQSKNLVLLPTEAALHDIAVSFTLTSVVATQYGFESDPALKAVNALVLVLLQTFELLPMTESTKY